MKQKFSSLFALLVLLLTGLQVSAQSIPKPFGIEQPSLHAFLPAPELATGRAVIACPGRGYSDLAINHRGYNWALYFNKQGIALIVLKYRMPKGDRTLPIPDAEATVKMVRDGADVWNLGPNDIGIMRSSAGGHLASTIATHAPRALRPDFQIFFYPVITIDRSFTHMGSHGNLLGKDVSAGLGKEFSNEKQMTKGTPRAFVVYSNDDKVAPPADEVNYCLALNKKGVPSVLHIYPTGEHGWGIHKDFLYKSKMQSEPTSWLRSFRAPRKGAVRVACIGNSITFGTGIRDRNHDGYPSVLAHMLGGSCWAENFGVNARTILNKGNHPYMNEPAHKDVLAFNPNIVVIKLGTSSSKSFNWKYKADFMKDAQTMVDAFKDLPSQPEIYLCYPSKTYLTGDDINDSIISREITPMIKGLAKKNDLSVMDLHTTMDGTSELFSGRIHPNEKGVQVMAKAICQSISTLE